MCWHKHRLGAKREEVEGDEQRKVDDDDADAPGLHVSVACSSAPAALITQR